MKLNLEKGTHPRAVRVFRSELLITEHMHAGPHQ